MSSPSNGFPPCHVVFLDGQPWMALKILSAYLVKSTFPRSFKYPLQRRSPKLSHSPQPPNFGDPVEHLSETSGDSLEAMSEGEALSPFSRGSRTRASLPVVRSTNQTKERSLGKP